ncbi:NACHT domain-containing protein [Actinokineospora sp. 24-640]
MSTRAFLSYAHDSDEHVEAVHRFGSFLRANGVDARWDRPAEQTRLDWPVWMMEQTRQADFVLVVASPAYRRRADDDAPADEGRGVRFEASLLRDLYYQNKPGWLGKILPVLLPGQAVDGIPAFLGPYTATSYRVGSLTVAGAESLLRVLTNQPKYVVEPVGAAPVLPPVPTPVFDVPGELSEREYTRVRRRYAEEVAAAWRSIPLDRLGEADDSRRIVRLPLDGLYVSLHADARSAADFQRAGRLLAQQIADRRQDGGEDGGTVEERIETLVARGGRLRDERLAWESADSTDRADSADQTDRADRADAGVSLPDAVARHQVLVLRGGPGSGKTVLCQRLGAQAAEEVTRGGGRVPLRVRLADYARMHADTLAAGGKPGPLAEFVARSVPVADATAGQVEAMLEAALERGQALVLLDGLDEVSAHREALLEAIVEFAGRHLVSPGNQLLITSRIAGYAAAPVPLESAAHYVIRPMVWEQITEFVANFFREVYADPAGARALLAELAAPRGAAARALASTPLHLTSMCLIWHRHGSLPESRAGLYRRLILDMAARWRGLVTPSQPDELRELLGADGPVLAMLAHVAATIHDHYPQGEIPEGKLLDVMERALLGPAWYTRPAPERLGVELLDVLRTRVGVLAEIGNRTYAFSHLNIQEYLAGLTLVPEAGGVTEAMLASMVDRLGDPRWREPVVLAVEELAPPARTALLRAVLARGDLELDVWAEVCLATGCTGDDGELAALAELAFSGCRELREYPDLLADLVDGVAAVRARVGADRFDAIALGLPPALLPVVASVYWERRWLSDAVLAAFTAMADSDEHAEWGRPVDRALRRVVSGPEPSIPLLDIPPRPDSPRLRELGLPAWQRARREEAERVIGRLAPGLLPLRDLFTGDRELWRRCADSPACAAVLAVLLGGLDHRGAVAADTRYSDLADLLGLADNPRTQVITESAATLVPRFGIGDVVYPIAVFLDKDGKNLLIGHAPAPKFGPSLLAKPVGPALTAALTAWALATPGDPAALRTALDGVVGPERAAARLAMAVLDGVAPGPDTERERRRALGWVGDAAVRGQGRWLGAVWLGEGATPAERAAAHRHLRWLFAAVAGRQLNANEPQVPAPHRGGPAIVLADRIGRELAQVDPDRRGTPPALPDATAADRRAALAWLPWLPTWLDGAADPLSRGGAAALSAHPAVSALDLLDTVAAVLRHVSWRAGWEQPVATALLDALRPFDLSTPAGVETAYLAWRTGVATEEEAAALAGLGLPTPSPASVPLRLPAAWFVAPVHGAAESVLPVVDEETDPARRLAAYHYVGRRGLVPVSESLLRRVISVDRPAEDVAAVLLDLAVRMGQDPQRERWLIRGIDWLGRGKSPELIGETLVRLGWHPLSPQARQWRAMVAEAIPSALLRSEAAGDPVATRRTIIDRFGARVVGTVDRVAMTALAALVPSPESADIPDPVWTIEVPRRGSGTILDADLLARITSVPDDEAAVILSDVERIDPRTAAELEHAAPSAAWAPTARALALISRVEQGDATVEDFLASVDLVLTGDSRLAALASLALLGGVRSVERTYRRHRLSRHGAACWRRLAAAHRAARARDPERAALLGEFLLEWEIDDADAVAALLTGDPDTARALLHSTTLWRGECQAVLADWLTTTAVPDNLVRAAASLAAMLTSAHSDDNVIPALRNAVTARARAVSRPPVLLTGMAADRHDRIGAVAPVVNAIAAALRARPPADGAGRSGPALLDAARARFAEAAAPVFPARGPDRLADFGNLHFQQFSSEPGDAAQWVPDTLDHAAALPVLADWLVALDADALHSHLSTPWAPPHRIAEWDAVTSLLTVLAATQPATVLTEWDPARYQPILSRAATTVPSRVSRHATVMLLGALRYLDLTPAEGPDLLAVVACALRSPTPSIQRTADRMLRSLRHVRGGSLVQHLLDQVHNCPHESLVLGYARLAAIAAADPQCTGPDRRAVRRVLRGGLGAPARRLTLQAGLGGGDDPVTIVRGPLLDTELRRLAAFR